MKTRIVLNAITFLLGVVFTSLFVFTAGCLKEAPELKIPGSKTMSSRTGEAVGSQGANGPCDSICRPMMWGNPLIVIKPTITSGTRNGIKWWQAKLDAKNYIPPTKYQQGVPPNWERVVVADTVEITDTIQFWICRWEKI